ncbi:MAG: YjiH family protein [Caloramator sp.]|nr:YjiH family protein [Caloramator sp.]
MQTNLNLTTEKRRVATLKFLICSLIGIFMFFISITINNTTTIPLDHIVTFFRNNLPGLSAIYALIVLFIGAIMPFYTKTWNKDKITIVFSILKVLGLVVGAMIYFNFGPKWIFEKDMGPFLYNKLVIPVGIIVPIGSVFLAFLVGYGLLEFVGVIMRPIMRPIWKTPGRSAVDAVASFVGSYSLALLITNKVFKEGKYTVKEAAIIATGFSTVSTTFMIIVAKTLGLMDNWNKFFWITFVVTFVVTAITARLYPLKNKDDNYVDGKGDPEPEYVKGLLKNAWEEGLKAASNAPSLIDNIYANLRDGFKMTLNILPTIMSIGLIGLVLAKYTPIFDILGYIFYPFTLLLRIPEPMLAAKACSVEIAEMFLPALLVANAPLITKFIIGVVSISAILFFSASIPCILSTEIPLTLSEILVIWFERTILALLIVTPIAFIIL